MYSDGDDFTEVLALSTLTGFHYGVGLNASNRRTCIDIGITDDDTLENNELFTLNFFELFSFVSNVTMGQSNIIISPNVTHIQIQDDDGK